MRIESLMKITKSDHKNGRLLNEKIIKEKLIRKAYSYMGLVRTAAGKFINRMSNVEELKCEKSFKHK